MSSSLAILAASLMVVMSVLVFLFIRLGFHQRLPLLFRRWSSINQVLEVAARLHGKRVIIELDHPLAWSCPTGAGSGSRRLQETRFWSAKDSLACVRRLAGAFDSLLAERGERVAIYKDTEFDLYLFGTAALRSGAIAVPINGQMAPEIASAYLGNVGATVLLTDASHWRRLQAVGVPSELRHVVLIDVVEPLPESLQPARGGQATVGKGPTLHGLQLLLAKASDQSRAAESASRPGLDDPHYIVHTSGTTGVPKGVLMTGYGMLHSLRAVAAFNLISRRDLIYLALPMNHQIVQLYLQAIFLLGVRAIVNTRFEGGPVLETLQQRKVTVFFGFPIAYIQLLNAGLETTLLPQMRIWGATADAAHEIFQRAAVVQGRFFRDIGLPVDGSIFVDGLGSSEVGIAALLRIATPWTRHYERRVGRRAPMGPRIKVVDDAGKIVPVGATGRFMIKGPHMLAGYWNAHDKLYAASRDGWWFTGDIMQRLASGGLVHLDREVDIIHTAGGSVYSLLLEEKLHKHPAVMDVCVFDVADGKGGRRPATVVALRDSHRRYPRERLIRELQAMLAEHEKLAFAEVRDWADFPFGVTGKTLKRQLRDTLVVTRSTPLLDAPPTAIDLAAADTPPRSVAGRLLATPREAGAASAGELAEAVLR